MLSTELFFCFQNQIGQGVIVLRLLLQLHRAVQPVLVCGTHIVSCHRTLTPPSCDAPYREKHLSTMDRKRKGPCHGQTAQNRQEAHPEDRHTDRREDHDRVMVSKPRVARLLTSTFQHAWQAQRRAQWSFVSSVLADETNLTCLHCISVFVPSWTC